MIHNSNQKEISIEDQKKIMVRILKSIDNFCTENNIMYYLAYGTLLGAVRHKGFIPWDDDVDIVMDRQNYEKFCKLYNDNRTDNFRLICRDNTPGYNHLFAKICDMDTLLIENVPNSIELGVYVDVFINDYLSNRKKFALKLINKIILYRHFISVISIADRVGRPLYKRMILCVLRLFNKIIKSDFFMRKINNYAKTYIKQPDSKYCGSVTSLFYGEKEIMESEWFGKGAKLEFEGAFFNVPLKYDLVLKQLYGDYMQLPPKDKQVTHHDHVAYWKNENHNFN